MLGISLITKDSEVPNENVNEENIQQEYIMPSLLDKFNHRMDENVQHGYNIESADYQKQLSLTEFCDKYTSRWNTPRGQTEPFLHLSNRRDRTEKSYNTIRLKPHLIESSENPKSAKYWLYCKYLCTWLMPCEIIEDLYPDPNLQEDELKNYWINKYNKEMFFLYFQIQHFSCLVHILRSNGTLQLLLHL